MPIAWRESTMKHTETTHRRRARIAWFALLGLGLALVFLAGCRDSGPSTQVYYRASAGQRLRIAVVPFATPPNAPDAGEAVTSTVITYLLSTGAVDVVEPGTVDRVMRTARFVPTASGGIDRDTMATLQQDLNVDAYLVGSVEEYGDVRMGPDTYPAVSFSARLIRASDNTIVWAASISRTGADKVKIFDIGRVSSIGKLTKAAVGEMAASFRVHAADLMSAPGMPAPIPSTPAQSASRPRPELVQVNTAFSDETRAFGEADLKALLPEVPGFTRDTVEHSKHFHDTVAARYRSDAALIEVKLVDYQKTDVAQQFVAAQSPGMEPQQLGALPVYSAATPDHAGFVHLNAVVGRFGLYVTAPQGAVDKARDLAIQIVAGGPSGNERAEHLL